MAFGMRSCMLCRTIEKYEDISERMRLVSISSRRVKLFPSEGICESIYVSPDSDLVEENETYSFNVLP